MTPAKTEVSITGATHLIAISNNMTYFVGSKVNVTVPSRTHQERLATVALQRTLLPRVLRTDPALPPPRSCPRWSRCVPGGAPPACPRSHRLRECGRGRRG